MIVNPITAIGNKTVLTIELLKKLSITQIKLKKRHD